jgi:hypothetical protein
VHHRQQAAERPRRLLVHVRHHLARLIEQRLDHRRERGRLGVGEPAGRLVGERHHRDARRRDGAQDTTRVLARAPPAATARAPAGREQRPGRVVERRQARARGGEAHVGGGEVLSHEGVHRLGREGLQGLRLGQQRLREAARERGASFWGEGGRGGGGAVVAGGVERGRGGEWAVKRVSAAAPAFVDLPRCCKPPARAPRALTGAAAPSRARWAASRRAPCRPARGAACR